jgi:hypothetical protein
MKAKVFNTANAGLVSDKSLASLLTVNYNTGLISFSVGFINKIKLVATARIALIQDEERPKDWYIQVGADDHGFALRKKDTAVAFNCVTVARQLLESTELIDKGGNGTVRFLLATDPTVDETLGALYAIITKSGKVSNRTRKK